MINLKLISTNKKLREFGFLIGLGLPIIFGWLLPILGDEKFKFWTLIIGTPFLLLAIAKPKFLIFPYHIWINIGNFLGSINSHLIFFVIYLFILFPIALIMYILRYDPLRKKKNDQFSYRENKKNHKVDFTRIF